MSEKTPAELLVCSLDESMQPVIQQCTSSHACNNIYFPWTVSWALSQETPKVDWGLHLDPPCGCSRVNRVSIHSIWVVKLSLISLARKWKQNKIYSQSNHCCQTCWRFSEGILDECRLHSWKHFLISTVVLCRSAGQGSVLFLTAYSETIQPGMCCFKERCKLWIEVVICEIYHMCFVSFLTLAKLA